MPEPAPPAPPDTTAAGPAVELSWSSLEGPPGGNTSFVAQDPYHPEHIYAGTLRGLYHSQDKGESWTLIPETPQATSLAFTESITFTCAGQVMAIDPYALTASGLGGACYLVAASDDSVFAVTGTEQLGETGIGIQRAPAELGELEWSDLTPPRELWSDLAEAAAGGEFGYVGVEDLVVVGEDVLATVVRAAGPAAGEYAESRLLVSHDGGASWEAGEIGFPEPLQLRRLVHQRGDVDVVFAIGQEPIADPPFAAVAEMLRVSRDGGRTWSPVTSDGGLATSKIGDVDLVGDRIVLTNIDFATVVLDAVSGEVVSRQVPPRVEGYSFLFPLDDQLFDITDPSTIYGRATFGWEGIIRSRDGGETWARLTGGMAVAQAANLSVHPTDPDVFITSGNLGYLPHLTRDGGATWTPMVGSNNMADEVAFDPFDPSHMLLVTELGVLLESRDGGLTWTEPAPDFHGCRVRALTLSPDQDVLYASNLGLNVVSIDGLRRDDGVPIGGGENWWTNLLFSPDYAYALAAAPDGRLFATYSPKKFETHGSVWRYDPFEPNETGGWIEVLRIEESSGITDIAVGPGDPYRVYAAGAGTDAAVWASDDGGETWDRLDGGGFDFVTVHAVTADPHDPLVAYAAPWGAGLFRTDDGGETWHEMDSPTVSVAVLLVNPDNPRHLVVGDRTAPVVWESGDGGATWEPSIRFDADVHLRVAAMAFHRGDLYVSLMNRAAGGPAVFAGEEESGATFRIDGEGIHPLPGMSRAALSFSGEDQALYAVGHIGGVFEFVGDRWVDISDGLPDMGFFQVLNDGGEVLVAGGSDVDLALRPRVADAGVVHNIYRWAGEGEWQPLLEGDPFGSPVKAVVAHPIDRDVLYAATGTGIYVSPDRGATWIPHNDGLGVRSIGALAVTPDRVFAGTLGGGVAVGRIGDGHSIEWQEATGPTPEIANIRLLPHRDDPGRLWASSYPGGVFRTFDTGATWLESNFGIPSFEVTDPLLQGYYTLAGDPTEPEVLYLGIFEHGVYRSTDGAATWLPAGTYGGLADAEIISLAVDPTDPSRLWLATADRGVLRSDDRGRSWKQAASGMNSSEAVSILVAEDGTVFAGTAGYGVYMLDPGADEWSHLGRPMGIGEWKAWDRRLYVYAALHFDERDEGRVYLGQFPGGSFVSDDGGETWTSSNLGVGNDGLFSISAHPEDPDRLFAGTYNGILRSDDRGTTWYDTSAGMPPEQWPFSVVIDDQQPEVMYTATKNGHNKGFCDRNQDSFCGVVMKSTDGGATWFDTDNGLDALAEYYMIVLDPRDHDVLYLSSSRGIYVSSDAGSSWHPANTGLEEVTEFYVRGNVAQNLKLTPDERSLLFAIVGYGVWQADLPELPGG